MSIYSRTGDAGYTSLFGGRRVRKSAKVLEVLGHLDELNAFLGLSKYTLTGTDANKVSAIQKDLFVLGAVIAGFSVRESLSNYLAKRVRWLEVEIDSMDKKLPQLKNFVLPGGCESSVRLHLARSVCRRCERALVALSTNQELIPFLNRLSDYLFALARYENLRNKIADHQMSFEDLDCKWPV